MRINQSNQNYRTDSKQFELCDLNLVYKSYVCVKENFKLVHVPPFRIKELNLSL